MPEHWGTDDEIQFLRLLGTTQTQSKYRTRRPKLTRLDLLLKYRGATTLRTDWTGLDRRAILSALNSMIKTETKTAKQREYATQVQQAVAKLGRPANEK